MGGDVVYADGAGQVQIDIVFHGKRRRGFLDQGIEGIRKKPDMLMEQDGQFILAEFGVFLYGSQESVQETAVVQSADIAVKAQMIIREHMGDHTALDVQPYLFPGIPVIRVIVVESVGVEDIGVPGGERHWLAIKFHMPDAAADIFKNIKFTVLAADPVVGIRISDARGTGQNSWRGIPCQNITFSLEVI